MKSCILHAARADRTIAAMDDAPLFADVTLERPADLPQRSTQIEQLARLTQQALDAYHRAGSGVEFANMFSSLAPQLQRPVGVAKP